MLQDHRDYRPKGLDNGSLGVVLLLLLVLCPQAIDANKTSAVKPEHSHLSIERSLRTHTQPWPALWCKSMPRWYSCQQSHHKDAMTTVDIVGIKRTGPGLNQVTFHCWDSDTSNEITVAFVLEAQPVSCFSSWSIAQLVPSSLGCMRLVSKYS